MSEPCVRHLIISVQVHMQVAGLRVASAMLARAKAAECEAGTDINIGVVRCGQPRSAYLLDLCPRASVDCRRLAHHSTSSQRRRGSSCCLFRNSASHHTSSSTQHRHRRSFDPPPRSHHYCTPHRTRPYYTQWRPERRFFSR